MLTNATKPWLGAAYYPEMWPLENIDSDIAQMKEAGCNCMRIGEFAWGAMEPREGEYDFGWLHTVVDKLTAAGIAVIMCTPSATPPQWLTTNYADTLAVHQNGSRAKHGARRHCCPNSPTMREFNRRIVSRMADEFAGEKGIIGWQIDNEVHYFNGTGCFCPICKARFREWLKAKYGTIDNLNGKWGMARWSLSYTDFSTIEPPELGGWTHPSLSYHWNRFMSDSYIGFIREQADTLHEKVLVPVSTDIMPIMGLDYVNMHDSLDIVMLNHYDSTWNLRDRMPFWFSFTRGLKAGVPYWVTETQTGWNGGASVRYGYRPEGFCRANSWLAYAMGGDMNMYWLWKCHPNGHELHHGSAVEPSGRFTHTIGEVQRLSSELDASARFLATHPAKRSRVALHFSNTAHLAFGSAPYLDGFNYSEFIKNDVFAKLSRANIPTEVVETNAPLDAFKLILSPALAIIDEHDLPRRLVKWINDGGIWVAGPLTDIYDNNLSRFTDKPFSLLEDIAGARQAYQIPFGEPAEKLSDGYAGHMYSAGFELNGATAISTYEAGPLKGLAAITSHNVGKGKVVLLGTVLKPDSLARLVRTLHNEETAVIDASEGVCVCEREGGVVLVELDGKEGYAVLRGEHVDVISGAKRSGRVELGGYDVVVLDQVIGR